MSQEKLPSPFGPEFIARMSRELMFTPEQTERLRNNIALSERNLKPILLGIDRCRDDGSGRDIVINVRRRN